MNKILILFSFFSFLSCKVLNNNKNNNLNTKKEILLKINSDLLPSLEDFLKELNLQHRQRSLIKMGVLETRHLLRFKKMDYQMMVK